MEMITWTDEAWRSARCLSTEMGSQGYKPIFPDEGMERIDTMLYGACSCVKCQSRMVLFPFYNDERYRVYTVCMSCGAVVRKGGAE